MPEEDPLIQQVEAKLAGFLKWRCCSADLPSPAETHLARLPPEEGWLQRFAAAFGQLTANDKGNSEKETWCSG